MGHRPLRIQNPWLSWWRYSPCWPGSFRKHAPWQKDVHSNEDLEALAPTHKSQAEALRRRIGARGLRPARSRDGQRTPRGGSARDAARCERFRGEPRENLGRLEGAPAGRCRGGCREGQEEPFFASWQGYVSHKGPLIVYGTEGAKLVRAFRNIPGVDVGCVDRLNLLKLAPGGHVGLFIIWTKSFFEKLDSVFGTFEKESEQKKGYKLPINKMVNSDLARIINSDEIQSVVNPTITRVKRRPLKKNPLKNLGAMIKLNPYAKTARRMALLAEAQRVKAKQEKLDSKRKEKPRTLRQLGSLSIRQ